jgi:hypothetical protein
MTDPTISLTQEGGRKRPKVKAAPKKKVVVSKKAKPQHKPRKVVKHGGDLVSDIKNLAIPFAILLAKQGIVNVFDKKKPDATLQSIVKAPSALIKSVAKSLSPVEPKKTKSAAKPKKTVKKGGSIGSDATKVLQETASSARKLVGQMTGR